jgi:hypothetical protein
MDILLKILSLHTPASLSRSMPIHPTDPSITNRDNPPWLNWEATCAIEKKVWAKMRRCVNDGIWGLLWINQTSQTGRRPNARKRDEDEEESEPRRIVSEKGWEVLQWLIQLWEKDQSAAEADVEPGRSQCSPRSMMLIMCRPVPFYAGPTITVRHHQPIGGDRGQTRRLGTADGSRQVGLHPGHPR